ncbi:MAG TPA: FAD-dependent oxidoreductase [Acidimicrobiia bacterium]
MEQHWDVVVVGAGLAGLTAAATAAATGASTLVVDAHQPGGRASTDERGRYRFNRGAHALYNGGAAEATLARLGVRVAGAAPPTGARGRVGETMDVLPATSWTLVRSRLLRARSKPALARLLGGMKHWKPQDVAGLTIGEWLDTFDLAEDARAVMRMLVRTTTYLNDEDTVSADVAAAQIVQGLTAGVLYLHGGWASLVDGVAGAAHRAGAELRPDAGATTVMATSEGFAVHGAGLDALATTVVLATGTPRAAASLLEQPPAAWSGLGPAVEASTLELGLTRALEHPVLFGIDVPIYLVDHAATAHGLAPEGGGLVHVLRYLALGEETPADQLRAQMEDHARVAGIDPATIEEQRFLRRMTVAGAAPTPANGGLAGRPGVDSTGTVGLYVAGDWVGPTGWLTDAVFASGEAAGAAAARRAAALAGRRPARQDVA